MTRELFSHADHDDEDDLAALPEPHHLRSEVASIPGPDLSPAGTAEVEPPPGTEDEPEDG